VLGSFRQHPLTRKPANIQQSGIFERIYCRDLLRRRVNRMNGLWHRRLRLDLKLRFGRQDLGADGPGSFASRTVTRHMGRLHLGPVPWPVVDDQHAENAKDCDRNRDLQWGATMPARTISCQILSHLKIRFDLH
jgi:hypothetical protein